MSDVFVAGALHWDVVVHAPRLPTLDETLMGQSVTYRLGGKGANQAVAAARTGAVTSLTGRVGRDDFGRHLRSALEAAGVNHRQVLERDGASGMSVAIVDADGEYGAVVVSAANKMLEADEVHLPADLKVLLLQNEVGEAVNLSLAKRASADTQVILNAAPARALPHALLQRVDVLIANRVEAAALTGSDVDDLDAERAALELCQSGPRTAIITLGAAGFVVSRAGRVDRRPAFKVRTVSSHGAGDVFCGALAAELARGKSLSEATKFGSAAAALSVSQESRAPVAFTRNEVQRLMRS